MLIPHERFPFMIFVDSNVTQLVSKDRIEKQNILRINFLINLTPSYIENIEDFIH